MAKQKKPMFPHPLGATRAQLKAEAMSLVRLAEKAIRVADTGNPSLLASAGCGICFNWKSSGCNRAYYLVSGMSHSWPNYSGDWSSSPIPEDWDTGRWEGMNLAHRLDLIAWMLQRYAEWLGAKK